MYKLPVILWYSNSENREVHVTFTIRYLTFYLKQILILIKLVALPFSKLDHRHLTYFSHVRCLWMVQTKGPCTSLLTARAKVNCYTVWFELSILQDLIFDAAWLTAKVIALKIAAMKNAFLWQQDVSLNVYHIIGYIHVYH